MSIMLDEPSHIFPNLGSRWQTEKDLHCKVIVISAVSLAVFLAASVGTWCKHHIVVPR